MRNQKDFIVVAPNPRFCVFLLSFILSSRQILSDRAALVLIQSAENVIINCNSSAINYSSMFVLLIFCLSPVCVCTCVHACVCERESRWECHISNNNLLPQLQGFLREY